MANQQNTTYGKVVAEFLALANGFTEGNINKSPRPGDWPASFVIHHMADCEIQFSVRFLNGLTQESANVVLFDEENYPDSLNYSKRSTQVSISAISAMAKLRSDILANIPDNTWSRKLRHPESGEISISDLMATVISHYEAHIEQLRGLKV